MSIKNLYAPAMLIIAVLCSNLDAMNIKDFTVQESSKGSTHTIELFDGSHQGQRIAYCKYDYPCFLNKEWAYFGNIFVEKHMRKKGIGNELCKYLMTLLKNQNCKRMCGMALPDYEGPQSEQKQMDQLINFYKKLGFVESNDSTQRNTMLGVPMHYDLK